ncbi:hypothetical protein CALCODRAFT_190010 [Calocera cornea HHB12733]|uniref:Uncharacterized protein n=1 Tax=Calocera cornea HHB12733 TaxID=1353952 RepID=A0A165C834_9BASI|nr:hypothetical protein CALCODRAFT_190010 [Calocera cornea HHB12733]
MTNSPPASPEYGSGKGYEAELAPNCPPQCVPPAPSPSSNLPNERFRTSSEDVLAAALVPLPRQTCPHGQRPGPHAAALNLGIFHSRPLLPPACCTTRRPPDAHPAPRPALICIPHHIVVDLLARVRLFGFNTFHRLCTCGIFRLPIPTLTAVVDVITLRVRASTLTRASQFSPSQDQCCE